MTSTKVNPFYPCFCGEEEGTLLNQFNIPMVACSNGHHRQYVEKEGELEELYSNYYTKYYTKCASKDEQDAFFRMEQEYKYIKSPVLDVGVGRGYFLEELIDVGYTADGQDIVQSSKRPIYVGKLKSINFPTENFSTVISQHSLEHIPNLGETLREISRILKPNGHFIVEFPDFDFPHHWKITEHLWMLNATQLIDLIESFGFKCISRSKPVESNWLLIFRRKETKRLKILVPPGIGDSLWSMVKLESFMKDKNPTSLIPFIYAQNWGKKKRSADFLNRIPFIKFQDYIECSNKDPVFQEAYNQDARTIFPNVHGVDYFLGFNGPMRFGKSLASIHPEYKPDWNVPIFYSLKEVEEEAYYKRMYEDFLIFYFVPHGMYKNWLKDFTPSDIVKLAESLPCKVVFVGASWDNLDFLPSIKSSNIIDLTGKTSFSQVYSLIRASCGVVGFPSGLTIFPTLPTIKKPTIAIWNDYFDWRFWYHAYTPNAILDYLTIVDSKKATVENMRELCVELIK